MESSECLLTSNLNDFLLKLTNFTWNPQMQVNFFLQIIFYKNRIFTKTIFLLNHTSWGYFLDYMNLPYQFGILRMCTFCWFDWFLSKPSIILVIHTNMCALFFSSDLMLRCTYRQLRWHMDIPHRIWNYFNLSHPNLIDVSDLLTLINGFETMLQCTYHQHIDICHRIWNYFNLSQPDLT